MQARKEYVIQFVGLSLGAHEYKFEVGDSFFADLEYSEIKKANIVVDLNLIKQSQMMVLEFEISGTVRTECDLCTEEFDLPIQGSHKLIVKVGGSDAGDEDDDIITVAANEHELDLSQFIYEYIVLSYPIKRVHPTDAEGNSTCNPDVIKKLKNFLIEDEETNTDPRWNGLKDIKLN